ncbi:MAG TPA: His/Gly/Thr/Pro-type tRNA ligase C-terminal domain-containing protein, partial [Burkholderiaceae bacterium]
LKLPVPDAAPQAFAVIPDAASMPQAMAVLEALRAAGVSIQMHAAGKEGLGSMKSQFKKADASGARFALVFGADELAQGMVAVKPLRDSGAAQWLRPLADAAVWAHEVRNA